MFSSYYKSLQENPNNLSFWFPKVKDCGLLVPATTIVAVPENIMELFFMEKEGMTQTEIMEEIYHWVKDVFIPRAKMELRPGVWFLKNGAFSNKFHFSDCSAHSEDAMQVTSNIISINYSSLMFETGGNAELVAREFIHPPENIPCIYSGMPLRTEVRVFYDFDNHEVVYASNYWDWDYCHKDISRDPTDKIVYEAYYPIIKKRYDEIVHHVTAQVADAMKNVTALEGIWSVDIMENNPGQFYLIDMALGHRSAYWNPDLVKQYYINKGVKLDG